MYHDTLVGAIDFFEQDHAVPEVVYNRVSAFSLVFRAREA
jgi:hypothetical protein